MMSSLGSTRRRTSEFTWKPALSSLFMAQSSSSWSDRLLRATTWGLLGSLQRDVEARAAGADARRPVDDLLVRDSVLAEVVPYHLGLYLDWEELSSRVDANGRPDHHREDYHVPGVGLYLALELPVLLGTDVLEELPLVVGDPPVERAPRPRREKLQDGLGAHRVELVDR